VYLPDLVHTGQLAPQLSRCTCVGRLDMGREGKYPNIVVAASGCKASLCARLEMRAVNGLEVVEMIDESLCAHDCVACRDRLPWLPGPVFTFNGASADTHARPQPITQPLPCPDALLGFRGEEGGPPHLKICDVIPPTIVRRYYIKTRENGWDCSPYTYLICLIPARQP